MIASTAPDFIAQQLNCSFQKFFFCVRAGPWSDTNGRKLLIVLPLIGQTLAVVVLIVALLADDLPAEFLLLW